MAAQETPKQDDSTLPIGMQAPHRRRWPWIIAIVAIIALCAGAWWYLVGRPGAEYSEAVAKFFSPAPGAGQGGGSGGRGGRGDANRALPVVAAPATKGSIDVTLSALGNVLPRNVVTVRARVDGQLMQVHFREGQLVRAGDLLAQIDPRPFEVQLTQAVGQLARDQALLDNARRDLERYDTLLAQDSISKQQRDTQESLVHQYQGAVKADQGTVDNARLQLTYARITAPLGGRVGLRQVDPGNMVHASDTNGLVVITQLQPITVLFALPEDNLPVVMKRLRATEPIVVDAFDRDGKTKLATGKLLTVDNQIDTATGTVKLKAEFANESGVLFANQFVNVRVLVDTQRDATLIPTAAIQRGSVGTFVYVVKEDRTVSVRTVKLGVAQGETTAIAGGLNPGEVVVVDGADKLREGGKVELITREAQTAAPAAGAQRRAAGAEGTRQRPGKRPEGGK
jgi:multidrug efflux system membrane fusion protein